MSSSLLPHVLGMNPNEVLARAKKYGETRKLPEDFAQEALVDILTKLQSGFRPRFPRAWLYTSTFRTTAQKLRRQFEREPDPDSRTPEDAVPTDVPLEMQVTIRLALEVLWPFLTDRQREVLELAAKELTQREIAEILDCALGLVSKEIHAIRHALKELIEEDDPDDDPESSRGGSGQSPALGNGGTAGMARPKKPRGTKASLRELQDWLDCLPAFKEGEAAPSSKEAAVHRLSRILETLPAFQEHVEDTSSTHVEKEVVPISRPVPRKTRYLAWISVAAAAGITGMWSRTPALPNYTVAIGQNLAEHRGPPDAATSAKAPRKYALDGAFRWEFIPETRTSRCPTVRAFLRDARHTAVELTLPPPRCGEYGGFRIAGDRLGDLLPPSVSEGDYTLLFAIGEPDAVDSLDPHDLGRDPHVKLSPHPIHLQQSVDLP